jgi:hypothetical protein
VQPDLDALPLVEQRLVNEPPRLELQRRPVARRDALGRQNAPQLRRGALRLLEHGLEQRIVRRLRHGHGGRCHWPDLNTRRLETSVFRAYLPP